MASVPVSSTASSRCAVHPGRLAVDHCPRCDRLRCAADAARHGEAGCVGCLLGDQPTRLPSRLELVVRAGLVGVVVALVGGFIATQYVDDHLFSLIVPGLAGIAAVSATGAAVRRGPGRTVIAAAAAAVAAVLATALGFRLVPGGQSPLHPLHEVGPPYLCAVLGAVLWPLLTRPPARRR